MAHLAILNFKKNGDRKMKMKSLAMLAASVLCMGTAMPSYADGMLGGVASFFGSTTALIIDIPEGILVHSLWRTPKETSHILAEKFGDEKGLGQNLAGLALGVPTGFVWGIPLGAIHGGRHALDTGWEKPFSTESYLVSE